MKKIENIVLSCFCIFIFNTLNASASTGNSNNVVDHTGTTSSSTTDTSNSSTSTQGSDIFLTNKDNSETVKGTASDPSESQDVDTLGDNIPDSVAHFDWARVMKGIIQVESKGNPRAVSGLSVGVMQITPVLVSDCNRILRRRRSKKRFSLRDRWSIVKSKEMFLIFQSFYNPLNDIERAIRSWNGGAHFSIKRTQNYLEKVLAIMKAL